MQICPNCSHHNRPGVVFCDNCGASLIGDSPLSTKSFGGPGTSPEIEEIVASAGSDVFGKGKVLRLEIEGAEPVLLKPKQETVFGRRDPATGSMPDVDLTPFAGYRMGVSRRHSLIKQNEVDDSLELWDLGSSNGSFLNGTRLNANRPYKIHDGDEIRFGQMVMHVYFQNAPVESSVPADNTDASGTPNGAKEPPQTTGKFDSAL
ncbi:MAG: FHA domain-containing protein [Chloroflexota bacterium]